MPRKKKDASETAAGQEMNASAHSIAKGLPKNKEKLANLLNEHVSKKQQLESLVLEEALFTKRLKALDEALAKRRRLTVPQETEGAVAEAKVGGKKEKGAWEFEPYVDEQTRLAGLEEALPIVIEPPAAVAFLTRTIIESLCHGNSVSEKEIKQ